MDANELRIKFNTEFTPLKNWPTIFEVDPETYGFVCQEILETSNRSRYGTVSVSVGINGGIMFKGVELILRRDNKD